MSVGADPVRDALRGVSAKGIAHRARSYGCRE